MFESLATIPVEFWLLLVAGLFAYFGSRKADGTHDIAELIDVLKDPEAGAFERICQRRLSNPKTRDEMIVTFNRLVQETAKV